MSDLPPFDWEDGKRVSAASAPMLLRQPDPEHLMPVAAGHSDFPPPVGNTTTESRPSEMACIASDCRGRKLSYPQYSSITPMNRDFTCSIPPSLNHRLAQGTL